MRRFLLLFLLPILACSGLNTTPPSTSIPDSPTNTVPSPVATPLPADTSTAPPPPNATSFPNADSYTWTEIASGLQRPVALQANGSGRLFIIEKVGRIRTFENGQLLDDPFLNIIDRVGSDSNEQGLLGLAFHPSQAGVFFVNYTNKDGDTVVSRLQYNDLTADPSSEQIILTVNQPFPNHNGGDLAFGHDGYLYIGLGDGGAAGDPLNSGQSLDTLLGKMLRIDVNDPNVTYTIPADNPFRNEIWAYGLRNPWRYSFDMQTGDLYIGDVGQGEWEEIDFIPAGSAGGQNFGWVHREGAHDYNGGGPADMVDPIAEYSHGEGGCSVTGGYVYRGAMPEWNGIYLYGDYCTGYVWGLIKQNGQWQSQLLFQTGQLITSFGQDDAGEVYLISDNGGVYQLTSK